MRTRRRLGALSLTALLAVALTGCMKVDMDLQLQSDDTVDGTMIMAVSTELAEMVGQDPATIAEEMTGDMSDDLTGEVTTEPYDDGEFVGTTMTFEGESLEGFNSTEDDSMTITREGDEFVVAGFLDLTGGGEEMPAGMMESMDIRVAITFPGEVTEHDGELEGTTVTWVPEGTERLEINARGSALEGGSGAFPIRVLLLAGIGLLVLLLVGLAVFLVLRSRRSASASALPAATAYPSGPTYPAGPADPAYPATAFPGAAAPGAPAPAPVPTFQPAPEAAPSEQPSSEQPSSEQPVTGQPPAEQPPTDQQQPPQQP